jgi:hypothetical protein
MWAPLITRSLKCATSMERLIERHVLLGEGSNEVAIEDQ